VEGKGLKMFVVEDWDEIEEEEKRSRMRLVGVGVEKRGLLGAWCVAAPGRRVG